MPNPTSIGCIQYPYSPKPEYNNPVFLSYINQPDYTPNFCSFTWHHLDAQANMPHGHVLPMGEAIQALWDQRLKYQYVYMFNV